MVPSAELERAASAIAQARACAVLTGAGLSVASGVPDFRSPSGLWQRFDPASYASLDAFIANPDRAWQMFAEVDRLLCSARPNAAHRALVALERARLVGPVITQNIDGLHQAAGSREVLELHGNAKILHCLGCGAERRRWLRRRDASRAPRCRCGNAMKPKVVLFGELLSAEVMARAEQAMQRSQLLLVAGTSASIAPANSLPRLAKAHGALIIEMNLEPTVLTQHVSDLLVAGPVEQTLPALATAVAEQRSELRA